jgi:hypothetical protein
MAPNERFFALNSYSELSVVNANCVCRPEIEVVINSERCEHDFFAGIALSSALEYRIPEKPA